ncbi:unnamed protein product [Arabidopsis thaliana]|uniref:Uncharacterized protein n=1 Tax=Arabidopsis thaliana TaxID=3702 RepID=A0A5S9XNN1_ARATH|nr:unnamed protein product [Arabidopsis thaliana]
MAKNKTLVTPSTVKKSSDVASTSKKLSGVASPAKKPSGVTSPVKKPLEAVASTSSEEEEEDEPSSDSESGSEREPEEKRAKTETETGKKPLLFQRLWTDEDEIVFLQGMIKFAKDTGKNVSEDMNGFFEKLKDSISFEVKTDQFVNKIRSMKRKYIENKKTTTEHDKKCYELAEIIWVSDGDATALVKPKKKKLKVDEESDWFERSFVDGAFKEFGPGVDEETWKKNWSLVPVKKRKRIEEKVKSMQADELKTTWQKIDVVHEMRSLMAKYV